MNLHDFLFRKKKIVHFTAWQIFTGKKNKYFFCSKYLIKRRSCFLQLVVAVVWERCQLHGVYDFFFICILNSDFIMVEI